MPKLSLAKLERHLYGAADRLRQEGLDAATYKDYIFGMLFLKRCSDVFDAEHEGIPACILVMRPNLTGQAPNPNKPEARACRESRIHV